ncbi:hypothetical protein TTHERM_00449620 (macronuclear) [Tetrahymena thermophila SB210]|uniref:Uncharacterized protein n=1 Tax=Tetrahymena thermophila (strain SB210) TaxID=312017 RepID=Q238V8_TETTS|nr:hypothetical protein TTHERM_00449620 [Tetrahymena thermophila SB210]EAR93112.1 hypothetical protein TTHERM_00449620 [Tetrahymena thermophila SB210]|eukprot:XP_001013357.1 hypothetical protein TTHERM_00449620 [Tetrahymena thermophila SB210]
MSNFAPSQNQILPVSIGQPVPSSFIIRQQQETLQRLQEQNQKQQQQIESLKSRYSNNIPNPVTIRSQSPSSNLLTLPRANTAATQQNTQFELQSNNNLSNLNQRSSTPPQNRLFVQSENSYLPNSIQTTQGISNLNAQIIPVTYSNIAPAAQQNSYQVSQQYSNIINRPVYKLPRAIQIDQDQPVQLQDISQNFSPQGLRYETVINQQPQNIPQQIPIIQNQPVIIASPEAQNGVQYLQSSFNGNQVVSSFLNDRQSFHQQQEIKTVQYIPVETVKQDQAQQQLFTASANRFSAQENRKDQQALFPENRIKTFQSSYRRQHNSSQDYSNQQRNNESLNKENERFQKSNLSDTQKYQNKYDQYITKDEHERMREKFIRQIEDLESQINKLNNDVKTKNIDIDTQKSVNEDLIKKNQKLESKVRELENVIENLKDEQEKLVDVCEKKDVEVEEQNLQLAEKQREVNEIKQKMENMSAFYTDSQEKLQLYEDTQEELQNQIQKNINLEQRNNFLNQEIQNSKQIVLDLEQQMKQLQAQLPPVPYKQIEQETIKMQQYIQNLEQRLLILTHEKNEEVQHWRSMAEIDSVRVFQEMENRCKFLANENERLNQIIVNRCIDMRQNW